jgi:hypothetical protein
MKHIIAVLTFFPKQVYCNIVSGIDLQLISMAERMYMYCAIIGSRPHTEREMKEAFRRSDKFKHFTCKFDDYVHKCIKSLEEMEKV